MQTSPVVVGAILETTADVEIKMTPRNNWKEEGKNHWGRANEWHF